MITFFLCCLSYVPPSIILEDQVDVIEFNHVMDSDTGKYQYAQLIFWDTSEESVVIDWRKIKRPPTVCKRDRKYILYFLDGIQFRRIVSNNFIISYSVIDPEFLNRQILKRRNRRGLSQRLNYERQDIGSY